jgi:UDP-N-acetylglucosamine 2-epimerase
MKLACVVGTRPQIIKAAAAWPALRRDHDALLIDTGQHYDEDMAGGFFEELDLPRPDHSLGVGSGSHAAQVAAMIGGLEPLFDGDRPDAVVVFGDTNSTLAAGLVAAKMDLPLAHVEAGLRSFDRRMPEEVNRVVVDHLAQLLLAPNENARANLRAEGIGAGLVGSGVGWPAGSEVRVEVVGDLMQDLCAATVARVRNEAAIGAAAPAPVAALGLRTGEYFFATVHRAENRPPDAIAGWMGVMAALGPPIVLALHPGTRQAYDESGLALPANVHLVPPLGYRTTLALQLHAAAVVTDSGGVQREAAWLGTPALVLRETTEWVETLEEWGGRSALVGRDAARALAAMERLAPAGRARDNAIRRAATAEVPPAGAAEAISASLGSWLRP